MSFDLADMALDNIPEKQVLPAGEEAQLVVTSCKFKVGKDSGNPMIHATFNVESDDEEADYEMISDYLLFPLASQKKSQINDNRRKLAGFCTAFDIPFDSITDWIANAISQYEEFGEVDKVDPFEEAVDKVGTVVVKIEEYEGRVSNKISRYIAA